MSKESNPEPGPNQIKPPAPQGPPKAECAKELPLANACEICFLACMKSKSGCFKKDFDQIQTENRLQKERMEIIRENKEKILKQKVRNDKEIIKLQADLKGKDEALGIVIKSIRKNLSLLDISQIWPYLYDEWEEQAQIPDNERVDFLNWVLEQALKEASAANERNEQ